MNANHGTTKSRIEFWVGTIIALLSVSVLIARAQSPAQFREMFSRSQQQNAQALKQYLWKSRNEVMKSGESKNTQLFLMRYDAAGNIQKTLISRSEPRPMPKGPLMASIAEKKKQKFIELTGELRQQVEAYNNLSAEKMQALLASAVITVKPDQAVVQIQGQNILQSADSMIVWLDAKTRKQRRVEINTFLKDNPVKAVIEFKDLPDGPTYSARTVVEYPKEALQLITENFDYERERR